MKPNSLNRLLPLFSLCLLASNLGLIEARATTATISCRCLVYPLSKFCCSKWSNMANSSSRKAAYPWLGRKLSHCLHWQCQCWEAIINFGEEQNGKIKATLERRPSGSFQIWRYSFNGDLTDPYWQNDVNSSLLELGNQSGRSIGLHSVLIGAEHNIQAGMFQDYRQKSWINFLSRLAIKNPQPRLVGDFYLRLNWLIQLLNRKSNQEAKRLSVNAWIDVGNQLTVCNLPAATGILNIFERWAQRQVQNGSLIIWKRTTTKSIR